MKTLTSLVLLAVASLCIATQSAVGTWKGHVVVDTSKMKQVTPAQRKALLAQVTASQNATYTLILNANRTYVARSSMDRKPSDADSGSWIQVASTVKLTSTKKADLKPGGWALQMSANGKTLTLDLPPAQGITGKLVFSR
jgi:hypothetical protein